MGSTPIRVFVVDDHELIRQGLRRLIEHEDDIELRGEAETAAEAIARIPDANPHVSNVLDKLGMESRTQAAVYAVRQRKDDR